MPTSKIVWGVLLIFLVAMPLAYATSSYQEERRVKKVKRVKRPTFSERDWDGIYFKDLFKDGLVGSRPAKSDIVRPQIAKNSSANATESSSDTTFAWSKIIGRETLEDEVKQISQRLGSEITTPVKFKSEYGKVHQSFSMLSMVFGVIREYDDEVRWKRFAGEAQASFERAAANSRVGTIQAYESCKRRKEDLAEMVRGGSFASDDKAPESLDWSAVVDRSPIMDRLELANESLKQMTANNGEFTRGMVKLVHESQMIAAAAIILTRENMTDADDDGYKEYAMQMHQSAMDVIEAAKNQDYESAEKAANRLSQSCDDCHNDWR